MTDPQSSIFEPAPAKSWKFLAALCCIGGHSMVWLIEIINNMISRHQTFRDREWLIPGIFIGLPLIGLMLLAAKRKAGWYISTIYFLLTVGGFAGTQIMAIIRQFFGSSNWYVFDLRENLFMLIAMVCLYLLLNRETQKVLGIGRKDRIWTISIAAALLIVFFAMTVRSTLGGI